LTLNRSEIDEITAPKSPLGDLGVDKKPPVLIDVNRSEIDEITVAKSPLGDLGVGFRGR